MSKINIICMVQLVLIIEMRKLLRLCGNDAILWRPIQSAYILWRWNKWKQQYVFLLHQFSYDKQPKTRHTNGNHLDTVKNFNYWNYSWVYMPALCNFTSIPVLQPYPLKSIKNPSASIIDRNWDKACFGFNRGWRREFVRKI